jgi:tRNA(His) 5'-end guanylyltransferase
MDYFLGDKMKMFEGAESKRRLMPTLPAIARLDGKAFHSFTRHMERPFDRHFHQIMVETTKFLVEETNAVLGYTQSDEITLVWHNPDIQSQIFMDGRVMKMTSLLAAYASAYFNRYLCALEVIGKIPANSIPVFDCRVWNVPSQQDVADVIEWRVEDAQRNSVLALGQSLFSHNTMQGKGQGEIKNMAKTQHNIDWDTLPAPQKWGTFVCVKKVTRKFTCAEIEKLPAKHAARTNPELTVTRREVQVLDNIDYLSLTNKTGFIFLN